MKLVQKTNKRRKALQAKTTTIDFIIGVNNEHNRNWCKYQT